uniref:Chemokine interleukin-8-like domain-containing protein n=1 Tax=Astyanax mexicanus TaxID=7994 RepID=A0A3B1K7G6_ASTMX
MYYLKWYISLYVLLQSLWCCVAVSRARVEVPILDFKLQRKNPPCVKAIIFVTAKRQYCIDPRQSWAQEKIKELVLR